MSKELPKPIEWGGEIPNCDFCSQPAPYDVPTNLGPWANLCELCLPIYGGRISMGFRRFKPAS
jgi:hypothetical protein